eukprot:NODE_435_length_8649_cov_0.394386.p4 type:complete len:289 gc:universal NODE_435_length_8649_cov_0.394386:8172-7306(-)
MPKLNAQIVKSRHGSYMTKDTSLSVSHTQTFLSGATGLAIAMGTMHPLDTIKTCIQKNVKPKNLSRGIVTSATAAWPQGGIRFMVYEKLKRESMDATGKDKPTIFGITYAAVVADICSSIVKVPREVVTSHMQINGTSFSNTISHVMKIRGPIGFFTGFISTSLRDSPFMVLLFISYELLQNQFEDVIYKTHEKHHIWINAMIGSAAGSIAGALTTPFDVIRTNAMTDLKSTTRTTADLFKQGGVKIFFRGTFARSVWWFGVCGVFFPIYEKLKGLYSIKSPNFNKSE